MNAYIFMNDIMGIWKEGRSSINLIIKFTLVLNRKPIFYNLKIRTLLFIIQLTMSVADNF